MTAAVLALVAVGLLAFGVGVVVGAWMQRRDDWRRIGGWS